MSASAPRRIAVVGPTHPIKGGIAQHTTVLAYRLARAGHDVQIVSWDRQYPSRLYPGQQHVDEPEFLPFEPTRRLLSWNDPLSWVRAARRIRRADLVVIAHVTPVQVVPYRALVAALGRRSHRPRVAVVAHNVLPHERSRVDELLVRRLLDAADLVVTHSDKEAEQARRLTEVPVRSATIAPFMPEGFLARTPDPGEHRRLLFFGLVRPYKGLDILLRALARASDDVRLRVVGEFWGGTGETEALLAQLGLQDRVELRPGYAAAGEVPSLFADVDALVLPYRSATGSQGVWTGFEFGVPVIATRAGHLADDVEDGIDGITVAPDDVDSLAEGLRRFYEPGTPLRLRSRVSPVDPEPYWDRYLEALLSP